MLEYPHPQSTKEYRDYYLMEPGSQVQRWSRFTNELNSIRDPVMQMLGTKERAEISDSNVAGHSRRMVSLAREMLKYDKDSWTQDEQHSLIDAALYHDLAEPNGLGDIPATEKTTQDDSNELVIFHRLTTLAPPQLRSRLYRVAWIALDPNGKHTKIGRYFNLMEKVGYLWACINALEDKLPNAKAMAREVWKGIKPALKAAKDEYPSLAHYAHIFDREIEELDDLVFFGDIDPMDELEG